MTEVETKYKEMVRRLVKNPKDILAKLTYVDCDLIHAVFGIAGEAGELLDAVKKQVIYNQLINYENLVEEMGDMEFYMEQLRQRLNLTREEVLTTNMNKLAKRYPNYQYTDANAKERKDKK